MLRSLQLLIPAIIPSWRFFDTIAPSPRIEFTLMKNQTDAADDWAEFRPRPANFSLGATLQNMFFNPVWNETLFLVSCSERLIQNPTAHSEGEIRKRLLSWLLAETSFPDETRYMQFRLVFVYRDKKKIVKEVLYTSNVSPVASDARS